MQRFGQGLQIVGRHDDRGDAAVTGDLNDFVSAVGFLNERRKLVLGFTERYGCPIRDQLRVGRSADQRTLKWWRTASGQEIHDNARVPDKIQKDLRVPDRQECESGYRAHPFYGATRPRRRSCAGIYPNSGSQLESVENPGNTGQR